MINENEDELITLKIGENFDGLKAIYIEISYEQTQNIIDKLTILKQKLDTNEINDFTYFDGFLKIFHDENILSKNCNLNNMIEISNLIIQNRSIENKIYEKSSSSNEIILNNSLPVHIGKRTIIAFHHVDKKMPEMVAWEGKTDQSTMFSASWLLIRKISPYRGTKHNTVMVR